MVEYVNRETAIRELLNDAPEQVGYSREDAADCIRYMDAADVAPVRHGRNINAEWPSLFECSVCGWSDDDTTTGDTAIYNYCPNCGAKMMEG